MGGQQVAILRVPVSLPCPVPVLPGTPDTMRDGEPIPLEERTERCAVDAFWMVGAQVLCDVHLAVFCEVAGIDFDDLVEEGGGRTERMDRPWHERHRYAQDDPALAG